MNALVLALALVAPASAADRPRENERATEDKALIEHPPVQWLKLYSLPIYRESWKLEGSVKSLAQDLPRVREAFAKVGAAEVGERLSYRCPKESAVKVLAALRKIGSFKEPAVRQFMEPVSRPEVQGKIQALGLDKAGHAAELAKMPAVSALVEELLGHLRGVETALSKPEVEVLIHLTVKEKNGS
ncbi:MAG: hypothetical protein HY926_06420 [Elusimicrobia bacterium]|nr:hypothetical protein [Elusimicrobiota bacterium]